MQDMYDVVVIGGGPGGSTVGSLLKKHMPSLSVAIFEKEKFPRDHVGESQLPSVSAVLHEMGCWEKVEAAGFPIKVGGTYRWGQSDQLWDFNFTEPQYLKDMERPGKYEGPRTYTAFQVDRAPYDEILLDHSAELGCDVFQETMVREVMREPTDPDAIEGLKIQTKDGEDREVRAKYYIDASGAAAVLRRAMDVPVDTHKGLQNVAFWDYWENAEWAVEIGVGGTRVQVLSLGSGGSGSSRWARRARASASSAPRTTTRKAARRPKSCTSGRWRTSRASPSSQERDPSRRGRGHQGLVLPRREDATGATGS
jgi:flavin-dependent dehydrogenase